MKNFIKRHIFAIIFIIFLIIDNVAFLSSAIPAVVVKLILWLSGFMLFFKVLSWIYSTLFYKVRNRILGIYLFTGFIPLFFLILLFLAVFYIFIFQALSLDMDHIMQHEISALRELSSNANSMFLTGEKINTSAMGEFLDEKQKDYPGLVFIVYDNNHNPLYLYGEGDIPFASREEISDCDYVVFNNRPYIMQVFDRHSNPAFRYDAISAVPLAKSYTDILAHKIGGHIFFCYLGYNKEDFEEEDDVSINISRNDEGELEVAASGNVEVSSLTTQKTELKEWKDSLPPGAGRFMALLAKDAVFLPRDAKDRVAKVTGVFRTDFRSLLNKYIRIAESNLIPEGLIVGLLIIIASMVLLAQAVSLIISLYFSFSITNIIKQLHKKSKEIAKGNFTLPIGSRRKDQLGELTRTFDRMSSDIQDLLLKVKEKEKLDNEIAIAQMVQTTFFPKKFPVIEGVEIFGGCIPAKMVSGDFYDLSQLDEDRFDFCIGDISGKGISASLLMASSLTYLRLESVKRPAPDIKDIIGRFNLYLYEYSAKNQFCSLIYGRIDKNSLKLEFINAGHPEPVIIRGDKALELESHNIVTGILKDREFNKNSAQLKKGDVIVLFTDGFVEIMTARGYQYSREQMIREIIPLSKEPLNKIYERLVMWVREISSENNISDDMTAVLIRI